MQPASAVMMDLDPAMADLELVKLIDCLLLHAASLTALHCCITTQDSGCPVPRPGIPQMDCALETQGLQGPRKGPEVMTQRLGRLSYGADSTCCLLCSLCKLGIC